MLVYVPYIFLQCVRASVGDIGGFDERGNDGESDDFYGIDKRDTDGQKEGLGHSFGLTTIIRVTNTKTIL